jgi:predicted transcriptional regulator
LSKREYLRRVLSEGRTIEEIARLFGITEATLDRYLNGPEESKLATINMKSELTKLDSFPLDTVENVLLFAFKITLESIGFLFRDIEEDLSGENSDRTARMIRNLIDGAYLLLAITKLERAGKTTKGLSSDLRFERACQNKAILAERLLDIAEQIEQYLSGEL